MTDGPEAAAAVTTELANSAAVVEQATPTESVRDLDAPLENAEPGVKTEQPVPDEAQEEAKRLSRSQRYQRKISALSGVIERTEARAAELERKLEAAEKAKATDTAPNPADFPAGEYDPAYIAKLAEISTLKAVDARLSEREKRDEQTRQTNAATTESQKLNESAAKVRERIADFDETLQAFREDGGEFAPHIQDAIRASGDKGPLIAYNLAKDPDLADRLNAMSPREALLEIGELRAKAALPERKTQTKAPAPLRTVTGGAAATATLHDLANSDDVTEYVAARRKAGQR